MAKVTSKLQVTIPKAIATRFGIRPGDEIDWIPAGDSVRVVPRSGRKDGADSAARLKVFDAATRRQAERQTSRSYDRPLDRGWTREDLYSRARPR